MINRSIGPPPFLINSPHQSSPFVIFFSSSFFFSSNLAAPCGLWDLSSLTRYHTQTLAMEVLRPNHWTSRECPLFATTDDPTLTHHNHLKAMVFTPGGGHSVGLDESIMASIHHYNIMHSIFTALKAFPFHLFLPSNSWQH